ncbi:LHFPL tetraspan subfamily member 3 protein-like [Chiloscyllium plagiosum]|uniref:LHFPL tetraspan subfamily member 3 protein-like n=1 Tax=Chiloscyllium plagiosum TaxID=36176 RepID=UPI001CB82424|nr:LHFPL tetraspan subfamily member 3 protein-like [Chiloscyllium plagiosum]
MHCSYSQSCSRPSTCDTERERASTALPVGSLQAEMLTVHDVAPLYQTDFVRNARAVAALWAVCTLCLALLEVVVLTEPDWVQAPGSGLAPSGSFGLFQLCQQTEGPPRCQGSLAALSPVPSFRTPAGFVGAALGLVLASICCGLGLYRCCHPATVYKVCAWLQFSAGTLHPRTLPTA